MRVCVRERERSILESPGRSRDTGFRRNEAAAGVSVKIIIVGEEREGVACRGAGGKERNLKEATMRCNSEARNTLLNL